MITPPHWAQNAIPTHRGWIDPRTKELLVSRRHNQAELDEWNGVAPRPQLLVEPVQHSPATTESAPVNTPQMLTEVPSFDHIQDKAALIEFAEREYGVRLDGRKSLENLKAELEMRSGLSE